MLGYGLIRLPKFGLAIEARPVTARSIRTDAALGCVDDVGGGRHANVQD